MNARGQDKGKIHNYVADSACDWTEKAGWSS